MSTYAYDRITGQIIALLEQGTVPWHKTWKASTGWPRNLVTKSRIGASMFSFSCAGATNRPFGSPAVRPTCLAARQERRKSLPCRLLETAQG
jgi:hypothetical protein